MYLHIYKKNVQKWKKLFHSRWRIYLSFILLLFLLFLSFYRDVLYRLRVQNLKLLEKAIWSSPENKTSLCLMKGQSEQNCHNYIKVLLSHGKKIFACGTNSFSPQCSWRGVWILARIRPNTHKYCKKVRVVFGHVRICTISWWILF